MNKEQLIAAKNAAVAAGDYAKAAEIDKQIAALEPSKSFYSTNGKVQTAIDYLIANDKIGERRSTVAPDGLAKGKHKATISDVAVASFNKEVTGIRGICVLDGSGTEVFASMGSNAVDKIKAVEPGQAVTIEVYEINNDLAKGNYCRVLL